MAYESASYQEILPVYGVAELARALGVSPNLVSQWVRRDRPRRYPRLPAPDVWLKSGPVWLADSVFNLITQRIGPLMPDWSDHVDADNDDVDPDEAFHQQDLAIIQAARRGYSMLGCVLLADAAWACFMGVRERKWMQETVEALSMRFEPDRVIAAIRDMQTTYLWPWTTKTTSP